MQRQTAVRDDPGGHRGQNPDRRVTAQVEQSTCWMAGSSQDCVEPREAGPDDETANRERIRQFVVDIDSFRLRGVSSDREVGRRFGLEWAEAFHDVGPRPDLRDRSIERHAVAL